MSIARVWGTQCTLDEKVKLEDGQIIKILADAGETIQTSTYGRVADIIKRIHSGEQRDDEINGLTLDDVTVLEKLAVKEAPTPQWIFEIGGSPAISAIADHIYTGELDTAFYVGNLVQSVNETLDRVNARYSPIFRGNRVTDHQPKTLSLESRSGTFKIMFPFSAGRNLKDLYETLFLQRLRGILETKDVFIGLGGLNKGDPTKYVSLIDKMRSGLDFAGIFVGTNSFEKYDATTVKGYLQVCYTGDVVSFNDAELRQVFNALTGKRDVPIVEMLQNLDKAAGSAGINPPQDQMKICHASYGSVLHTTGAYNDIPRSELSHALQLACDATSLKYATGYFPTEPWVKNHRFVLRQDNQFSKGMAVPSTLVANGMAHAVASQVSDPLGGSTGLGAIFDGILCISLSKYVIHARRMGVCSR